MTRPSPVLVPSTAWMSHAASPVPCFLLQPVWKQAGEVCDFEVVSRSPAAEALARDWGLGTRLSDWAREGARGVTVEVCARALATGVPLVSRAFLRRDGLEARFRAVGVRQEAAGLALWLQEPDEAEGPVLREVSTPAASEEVLRLALDTARMVAWEWSEARGAVTWSRQAESFFGQPPGSLGGTLPTFLGCVVPEDRPRVLRVIEQALAADTPSTLTFRCRHADGVTRWYEAVGRVLRDDGHGLRMVGVVTDCTEREQASATLREAEERYRLAARATHDVLWDWDLSSGQVRWEMGADTPFGYAPDRLGHDLDWWRSRVHPDERAAVAASLLGFRDSGRDTWQAEYRFLRADGTWAHVLDRGVLARDAAGAAVRMIGSMMDITERKRALERMEEEARFRERFIGILGHDLRNPLNAITLSSRALRRRSATSSTQQQLAQRIEASAARMGSMISDILDLTRARLSGGIPLDVAPADLASVCRQVVEELSVAHPERPIAFDVEGRSDGMWDVDRLAQVLSNLVGNALEHGEPDSPVFLRCFARGGQQVVEVNNPGTPIPEQYLSTLFDPFRQAGDSRDKGRRRGGLGLGLFIVKEIVLAHGGEVGVASSVTDGTTFTVTLPRDARKSGRAVMTQGETHRIHRGA